MLSRLHLAILGGVPVAASVFLGILAVSRVVAVACWWLFLEVVAACCFEGPCLDHCFLYSYLMIGIAQSVSPLFFFFGLGYVCYLVKMLERAAIFNILVSSLLLSFCETAAPQIMVVVYGCCTYCVL